MSKSFRIISVFLFLVVFSLQTVFAAVPPELGEYETHFKTIYTPGMLDIKVPTLVKVFVPGEQDYPVRIFDEYDGRYQPFRRMSKVKEERAVLSVIDSSSVLGIGGLLDDDFNTSADFDLDEDGGAAFVVLRSDRPIASHSLRLSPEAFVALPHEIAISAKVDGLFKTVVARRENRSRVIDFPETTSQEWKIEMWHSQPLRLSELELVDESQTYNGIGEEVVWLAQPEGVYVIYADAQAYEKVELVESGNLYPKGDEVILALDLGAPLSNEFFEEPDSDDDGVIDLLDNCVNVENSNQDDVDENGLGDACEDHDRDGIMNSEDNCPNEPNRRQSDVDGDGIGDVCDGEESRVTERLPWLPWAAMGFATILIVGMIVHTVNENKK